MKNSSSRLIRCSNCETPTERLHSGIKGSTIYQNFCDNCVGALGTAVFARQYDRQWQRREYAKDIIQPSESGFAKIYGEQKARENGWSDAELRKHG